VKLALKVVIQNDGYFVDVILLYRRTTQYISVVLWQEKTGNATSRAETTPLRVPDRNACNVTPISSLFYLSNSLQNYSMSVTVSRLNDKRKERGTVRDTLRPVLPLTVVFHLDWV
jgi:hypothetical protein